MKNRSANRLLLCAAGGVALGVAASALVRHWQGTRPSVVDPEPLTAPPRDLPAAMFEHRLPTPLELQLIGRVEAAGWSIDKRTAEFSTKDGAARLLIDIEGTKFTFENWADRFAMVKISTVMGGGVPHEIADANITYAAYQTYLQKLQA